MLLSVALAPARQKVNLPTTSVGTMILDPHIYHRISAVQYLVLKDFQRAHPTLQRFSWLQTNYKRRAHGTYHRNLTLGASGRVGC